MRFVMVDDIIELEAGKKIRAKKTTVRTMGGYFSLNAAIHINIYMYVCMSPGQIQAPPMRRRIARRPN